MTYPDSLLSTFEMEAMVGVAKTYAIRLRRKGTITNWDVSSATAIQLEVSLAGEPALPAIPFASGASGADFPNGRLVGTLGTLDVCARVGSYECVITAMFSGVLQPIAIGSIEVLARPISTPVIMTGGFYTAPDDGIALGFNSSATVTIPQGAPVVLTPAGLVLASSTEGLNAPLCPYGVALGPIAPLRNGLVLVAGSVALADWTAVAGTTTLTTGEPYYVSATPGQLTLTEPAAPMQLVGESFDGTTLTLQLPSPT